MQIVKAAPEETMSGGRPVVTLHGETFKHFQTAEATTEFVLGEFPWQVHFGDRARTRDFIAPPRMLSEESTDDETTWSLGTYMTGAQVWAAFSLPGKAPRARGVFANQPDEFMPRAGSLVKYWLRFVAVLVVLGLLRLVTASRDTVFETSSFFRPGALADSLAFVTPTFQVKGRTANLEVTTEAQVDNGWAYFDYALVNETTGQTYEFGREVSYYYGRDSDGNWSEGSRRDRTVLPSIPAGPYFLRVLPEAQVPTDFLEYRIVVRRDVPIVFPYLLGLILLAVPPVLLGLRAWGMESARWKESDYAPAEDDDDDDE